MDADGAARDKVLKSRKTLRYVAELGQRLGLHGVLRFSCAGGAETDVPIGPPSAAEQDPRGTAGSEAIRLSWRGAPVDAPALAGLGYAIGNYVETEHARAEVSRHALEKYRELALLYKFGEGLGRITRRQDLVDLGYSLISARVAFDCFLVAIPTPAGGGWELLQPAQANLPALDRRTVRFDALSALLSGGNSRILNGEGQSLWDASVARCCSLITVPLQDRGTLLGGLVLGRSAPDRPFSSEDEHLFASFGFLFAGKLADIHLLERMLRDERMVAIGNMASSIIHDVKNPLTSVMAFAQLLGELEFSPDERKQYSELIVGEVKRLTGMIEDLLEFTRGGGSRYEIAPLAVAPLLEQVASLLEPDLAGRDIRYETHIESNETLLADAGKLKRVLLNLAGNARDAMESGGTLRIVAGRRDGMGHVSVQDTGPGIPEEIRDRLFEPFVTSGKKGGTGLGTAISRKIIEEMGGKIWFQSERGRGTTFHLQLPLA